MGEHANNQVSPAMERLLDVLNADFLNEASLPQFLQQAGDRSQGPKLQNELMRLLGPIMVTDPEQRKERRKAILTAFLHHAERRHRPAEELHSLRARLERIKKEGKEQLQHE